MRALFFALIVGASACSTSGSSSNVECTHASQCVSVQCRCNLGKGDLSPPIAACVDEKCETIDQLCQDHCRSNGGVKDEQQVASLVGSTDCDAFCNRWSLDCGGSCAIQACEVDYCEAATRASLQCFAKKGIADCQNFIVIDPDCIQENFVASCPVGDAGTDGGPDADAGKDADAVGDGDAEAAGDGGADAETDGGG